MLEARHVVMLNEEKAYVDRIFNSLGVFVSHEINELSAPREFTAKIFD